jgi:uncharacterized protein YjbI with pentapeptide repeats
LLDANLQGSMLSRTHFKGASIDGAQFQHSDPEHAELAGAEANEATIWPAGFDPEKAGVLLFSYPDESHRSP